MFFTLVQSTRNSARNSKSRRTTAPCLACTRHSRELLVLVVALAVPRAELELPVTSIWRVGWPVRRRISKGLLVVRT